MKSKIARDFGWNSGLVSISSSDACDKMHG